MKEAVFELNPSMVMRKKDTEYWSCEASLEKSDIISTYDYDIQDIPLTGGNLHIGLEDRLDSLYDRFDEFSRRIDNVECRMNSCDAKLEEIQANLKKFVSGCYIETLNQNKSKQFCVPV